MENVQVNNKEGKSLVLWWMFLIAIKRMCVRVCCLMLFAQNSEAGIQQIIMGK